MSDSLEEHGKKIKNLKICTAVLSAISGGCALVPHPIAKGVAIATGLAGVLFGLSKEVTEANYMGEPAVAGETITFR